MADKKPKKDNPNKSDRQPGAPSFRERYKSNPNFAAVSDEALESEAWAVFDSVNSTRKLLKNPKVKGIDRKTKETELTNGEQTLYNINKEIRRRNVGRHKDGLPRIRPIVGKERNIES